MEFDIIIGLDFGHGEIAAIGVRKEHPEDYMPMSLTQNRDKVIPAVIHYGENGEVSIGDSAANKEGMIAYFKTAPGDWTLPNGEPLLIKGHRVKEIMRDFFRELSKNIRAYNVDSILKDGDRIHLVVGCPASPSWMDDKNRTAYEALIREATGIENVSVVSESRGAIFSAFFGREMNGISASDGIAVFDFGSLTADFTYLKMGEVLMERSWDLGASHIERAMLSQVLDLGRQTLESVYREQENLLLHKLRREKEMYYSGTLMAGRSSIDLICTDETGDPVLVENRNGKMRPKTLEIRYPDENSDMDEFMSDVVSEETFDILQNGTSIGRYSWHAGCRAFFAAMKTLLNSKGLPNRMIVLTGGASRMPFVRELACEVFSDTEVVVEQNPSITVARGLCIIGDIDQRVPDCISRDRAALYEYAYACYLEMVNVLAQKVSGEAVTRSQAYLNSIDADITVGEFQSRVEDTIHALMTEPAMSKEIDEMLKGMVGIVARRVAEQANEAGRQIYRKQATLDVFRVDPSDIAGRIATEMTDQIKSSAGAEVIRPEMLAKLVVVKVVKAVLIVVGAVLFIINPLAGLIAILAEDLMENLIAKWYTRNPKRVIKLEQIVKAREKYAKERQKNVDSVRDSIISTMRAQLETEVGIRAALDACVDDSMSMAYAIVAMQSFETVDIQ